MNYELTKFTYPSSDGVNNIAAEIYAPKSGEVKGIVQLSHGMVDYVERYTLLADYLTGKGYVLAGNCHLGHGDTVKDDADFGFFASKNGVDYVLRDLKRMNEIIREKYPDKQVFFMGHSMGSFLSRLYALRYRESIDGIFIHGTAGPNPLVGLGKLLAKFLKLIKGERHRSKLIDKLSFGPYNNKFDPAEGPCAWLSRDNELIKHKRDDKRGDFIFTLQGYIDLFGMIDEVNRDEWFEKYPKDLPTIIMSGGMDPVGDYGKGVEYVHDMLKGSGVEDLTLKLYEGARHELCNEINRNEVFEDMISFMEERIK